MSENGCESVHIVGNNGLLSLFSLSNLNMFTVEATRGSLRASVSFHGEDVKFFPWSCEMISVFL